MGEVSRSLPLVGDFNFPDICWICNTTDKEQSQKFLECVSDNFLTQLVKEPTRGSKILDLLFVNKECLVGKFNFPDICWNYNTADREQSLVYV